MFSFSASRCFISAVLRPPGGPAWCIYWSATMFMRLVAAKVSLVVEGSLAAWLATEIGLVSGMPWSSAAGTIPEQLIDQTLKVTATQMQELVQKASL